MPDPRTINQQIGNPFPTPSAQPEQQQGGGMWAALLRMFGGGNAPATPSPLPSPQAPQFDPDKVRRFQQGGGFNP
jgi:hypothetical protein